MGLVPALLGRGEIRDNHPCHDPFAASPIRLAVLVLLAATTLSVYKPWGQTRHGQRKRLELRRWPPGSPQTVRVTPMFDPERETANIYTRTTGGGPRLGPRIGLAVISVVVALFILLHLTGVIGGHGH